MLSHYALLRVHIFIFVLVDPRFLHGEFFVSSKCISRPEVPVAHVLILRSESPAEMASEWYEGEWTPGPRLRGIAVGLMPEGVAVHSATVNILVVV